MFSSGNSWPSSRAKPLLIAAILGAGLSIAWAQGDELAPPPPKEELAEVPAVPPRTPLDPRTSRAYEIQRECEAAGVPIGTVFRDPWGKYVVHCKKGSPSDAAAKAEAVKAQVLSRPPLELNPKTAMEAVAVLRRHPGHEGALRLLDAEYDRVWKRAKANRSR